jgi:hypothetical protein
MTKKLNTYVHVVELDDKGNATGQAGVFGPDDDLPTWAAKSITNPDVWDSPEQTGDQPAGRGRRMPGKADTSDK